MSSPIYDLSVRQLDLSREPHDPIKHGADRLNQMIRDKKLMTRYDFLVKWEKWFV
jgi:hypothetical protein